MYYLYILSSKSRQRTYVGQTDDLQARLKTHNVGKVRSTKAFRPWELVYFEECATRGEAMERETWFKSPAGRKKIGEILGEKRSEGTGLSDPDQGSGSRSRGTEGATD